ncbi:O-antigen/teichoic acid export membrane protein [Rhodoligotrophos appendicifer]|uniref:lipopolysaccharide biosynthesis protein n=1 Tax=Rhodoligotrophos appendicifer TaxID=987056 RepID=UPI001FEB4689|nr:lipopolysaccharide biosynthesis protein [Rhodoligotrophos appendicifer]
MGVSEQALTHVLLYATVLLFCINGFPTAVMRLAGRFRIVAYGSLASVLLRLLLCLIGLWRNESLAYFVAVWGVTQILGSLVFLGLAFWELRRQGVRHLFATKLVGVTQRFRGLWQFTIGSNVELTLRSSANELDTLFVGLIAGPAAAGLYHMAKRLGRLVLQLGVQVQAVLYPDVARLWAQQLHAEFRRAVLQVEIMLAVFGVALISATALAIRPVLSWTVGTSFVEAAPLAVVQMIAVAMTLSGSAVRTALLAMGRQTSVLKIVAGATIAFHATALTMIPLIGAMGATLAHVVMAAIWIVGLNLVYRSALRSGP